ncbi:MAG TPA: M48 family metalloprotease [Phycisphaerales bacterium]|nr:M48 family metalloprotease [Phycisphaerales bacterium]
MARALTAVVVPALLAAIAATGCSTNPATGRSQFNSLSREQEIALGTEAMPQMINEYGGKVPSQGLQDYVTRIGKSLATHTEADNPSLPWEFTLLNANEINAFATPGGKVYVARGLAERMTNEAQLAAVLGHEIGHVTARHISEQISRQTGIQLGTAIGGAIIAGAAGEDNQTAATAAGVGLAVGGQLVGLHFSRAQESESDRLGLRYMTLAGYDPRGMEQTMEILAQAAGSGRGIDFFATHPDPAKRRAEVANLVRTQYASTQGSARYQLFADRFRSEFLTPLKSIPASPAKRGMAPGAGGEIALDQPVTWCAHCAAAAEKRRAQAARQTPAEALLP